jgi:excisionase family DNA binding protein
MTAILTKICSPDDAAAPTIDTTELPPGALLLSPADVAGMLRVSLRTLWRMAQAGILPRPVRFSRKLVRWLASDIQAWADSLSAAGPADPDAPVQSASEVPQDLAGIKVVARLLNVHPATAYRLLASGRLKAWRCGGQISCSRAEVLALKEQATVATA